MKHIIYRCMLTFFMIILIFFCSSTISSNWSLRGCSNWAFFHFIIVGASRIRWRLSNIRLHCRYEECQKDNVDGGSCGACIFLFWKMSVTCRKKNVSNGSRGIYPSKINWFIKSGSKIQVRKSTEAFLFIFYVKLLSNF